MANTSIQAGQREYHPAHEPHPENGTSLGFWLYLMSDVLIFAALFATFGVLGRSYAGGPTGAELFSLELVAINTAFLLLSSLTFGFAMLNKQKKNVNGTLGWLAATGLLGLAFLAVEIYEFAHIYSMGATIQTSAFLSSFFTLVGTHGLHVSFGLIWLVVLMVQIKKKGLIHANVRRLNCLSMFWHFLDVVWIGVFTFVYLMGVL
ncbi:MAG: cytochrome o ubiquinol oxidase subunit III [Comamonadaceae bacterium]|nr:cytochrome o ubiquinol oxidase subunit III [Comamonadaceae bacterium]